MLPSMGAAPHQVHSVFLGAVVPHAETSSFSFLNLLFLSKFLPSRLIRSPISAIPGGSVGCRARGYWLQGCGEHPFPSHWSPTHPSTIGMPLRPPHSSGKGPDLWGRNLVEVGGVSATPSCSLAAPHPPGPRTRWMTLTHRHNLLTSVQPGLRLHLLWNLARVLSCSVVSDSL